MFLAHPLGTEAVPVSERTDPSIAAWFDLLNPTDEEHALAERLTGLRIPTRQDVEEIESSSRVYTVGKVLYLSTPLVRRFEDTSFNSPVGFVLSHDRLVTIRYTDYMVFETVGRQLATPPDQKPAIPTVGEVQPGTPPDAETIMQLLLEAMVDRLADILEIAGHDLDALSKRVFSAQQPRSGDIDRKLRALLSKLGTLTDLVSSVRDSLLGLQRIATFVRENGDRPCSERFGARLTLMSKDISSLNDYDAQLNNKTQFLLDATLGFINIEQNNGIKLLTVVSLIGIPPTLIASIYGMNFKDIPELNWSFGYWYALSLMALTIVLPLIWFWRKGWLGSR